jgi:hypothetical protein
MAEAEPRISPMVRGPSGQVRAVCGGCAIAIHAEIDGAAYWLYPAEYVYTHPRGRRGEPRWFAHRVIKKNDKQVWVCDRQIPAEDVGTPRERRPTRTGRDIILSRADLAGQGWTRSSRRKDTVFYARPHMSHVPSQDEIDAEAMRRHNAHAHYCASGLDDDVRALGLSWPCTADDLKGVYRRLAMETHPDRGGSAEAFRRVNDAYQRLSALVVAPREES